MTKPLTEEQAVNYLVGQVLKKLRAEGKVASGRVVRNTILAIIADRVRDELMREVAEEIAKRIEAEEKSKQVVDRPDNPV